MLPVLTIKSTSYETSNMRKDIIAQKGHFADKTSLLVDIS